MFTYIADQPMPWYHEEDPQKMNSHNSIKVKQLDLSTSARWLLNYKGHQWPYHRQRGQQQTMNKQNRVTAIEHHWEWMETKIFKCILPAEFLPPDSAVYKSTKLFRSHGDFLNCANASSQRTNQIKLTYYDETKKTALDSQTVKIEESLVLSYSVPSQRQASPPIKFLVQCLYWVRGLTHHRAI